MKRNMLIVAMILMAGCLAPTETDVPSPDGLAPSLGANDTAPEPAQLLQAGFVENATTKGSSVNYTVSTKGSVTVQLLLNGTVFATEAVDGTRSWSIPLPYGRTPFAASFAGEGLDEARTADLVRLGLTKLRIDYGVYHPSSQGMSLVKDYELWIDVADRPSAPMYAKQNAKPMDAFTAHDQLTLFEKTTGKTVEYAWSASFKQFSVNKIDGAGNPLSSSAPPYWCYTVNAKAADGISIQRVSPGDAVVWRLGTCT
jgi:hypothetical protein